MTIETPPRARQLHRPAESAAGTVVFAFDRDDTIDVNPPPWEDREGVPLEWVVYLAHRTDHVVYATGNQLLKREATIPGLTEILEAHPETDAIATTGPHRPARRDCLHLLADLYPEADDHVVVDDVDLSSMDQWTHYFSWDFVPAANDGTIVPELPPAAEALADLGDLVNPMRPGNF